VADPAPAVGYPPTFVVIGGQRCGTTWIHRCLAEHPEVFTATPKELHYFDRELERGRDWYFAHFTPSPGHRAWGEATPAYLALADGPARLRSLAPEARLVCCLREPVARAYSAYQLGRLRHVRRGRRGPPPSFEEALETDSRLLDGGLYADQLRRWLDLFPERQLLVLLFDRLVEDEGGFMAAIYRHLGVDDSFSPRWLGRTYNAVLYPRLRGLLHRVGLEWGVERLRASRLGDFIRARHQRRRRPGYRPMRSETRGKLAAFFAEPNRRLEGLLGVDLTAWRAAGRDVY
jgi:hypothetical protein